MGSHHNPTHRVSKWGACWGSAFPCLKPHKGGGKRIVPAAAGGRNTVEATTPSNQHNNNGSLNHPTSLPQHLLAPPSSPASFTHSALPSTAQSPTASHLSISPNSPPGTSNTMFATGPYAHETQLVTPPVFSTFTTQPSTAPLTPPPELAHLTTPSSPDVPYARFLSSSADLKYAGRSNDLQATYPLSPSYPDRDIASGWDPKTTTYPTTPSSGRLTPDASKTHDSNFFCPATFAQFYQDQPHSGGRLSISRDSDVPNVGAGKQSKNNKQDVEEIEAYRASFGFSADEMITTTQYVEISDVMDESFTMMPCTSNNPPLEETTLLGWGRGESRTTKSETGSPSGKSRKSMLDMNGKGMQMVSYNRLEDDKSDNRGGNISGQSTPRSNIVLTNEDKTYSDTGQLRNNRKYDRGQYCSDAEIEYRRGRSLRECRADLTWY